MSAAPPAVPASLRHQSPSGPAARPESREPVGRPGWEFPGAPSLAGTDRAISAAVPAPVEVERLTDQVVAAIDRRLLAHRERTGRGWT
jgi:hypothetical protein